MTPLPSRWEDLLGESFRIIAAVNRNGDILDGWTFGGGTALMLQLGHRESHDVDLFLDDARFLPYVEATVAEMQFDIGIATYNGDGRGHPKIAFDGIGEIDFIVAGHVTHDCARSREILGREVPLETAPEIIAKKIRHRGTCIQPRDVFDIAAAVEAGYGDGIRAVLDELPDDVARASACLAQLPLDRVEKVMFQLMIRQEFKGLVPRACSVAQDLLSGE